MSANLQSQCDALRTRDIEFTSSEWPQVGNLGASANPKVQQLHAGSRRALYEVAASWFDRAHHRVPVSALSLPQESMREEGASTCHAIDATSLVTDTHTHTGMPMTGE